MRRRPLLVLLLMVTLPLGLLAWLGVRVARSEGELVAQRLREAREARLRDMDGRIQEILEERARYLTELTQIDADTAERRRLIRRTPEIDQLFVQAADGRVLHPPAGGELSASERDFLVRTRTIFDDRLLWQASVVAEDLPAADGSPDSSSSGWYPWYWDRGLHLLFWRLDGQGHVAGAELSRVRLLADLVDLLPSSARSAARESSSSIVLVDSRDRVVYRWGESGEDSDVELGAELALGPPLGAWRLRHYQRDAPAGVSGIGIVAGVGGFVTVTFVLAALSVLLYLENRRDLRQAQQRVGFVNQVSHELRTPLTNIRLYAELLETRLADEDPKVRQQLGVIVSESQRLSRLIGNVLAFARQQRGKFKLRRRPAVLDDTVAAVVGHFRPALEGRGVEVEVVAGAPSPFPFDGDAVEQILSNLLSNVEKYAAGGRVRIATGERPQECWLTVTDGGPGVGRRDSEAIFQPFYRVSDRLTEGVAGTGIGLSIARELARLHGGDLRLLPSPAGASFELTLPRSVEDAA